MRKLILAGVALVLIVSATSATAASLITSSQIQDGTIRNRDIAKSTVSLNRLSKGVQALIQRNAATSTSAASTSAPAGAKGDKGAAGEKGAKGDTGAQGPQGVQGVQGAPGQNADGSYTKNVRANGEHGVKIENVVGTTGLDNGRATLVDDNLRMQVLGNGGGFARATVADYSSAATKPAVSSITSLVYKFAVAARPAGTVIAPALKIDVVDATRCDGYDTGPDNCKNAPYPSTPTETTLIYEPTYSAGQNGMSAGTVDALASGNKWWASRGIKVAKDRDTFVSLQSILAGNPSMKVLRVYLDAGQNGAGSPWNGFDATVDFLNYGIGTGDVTRFDFGL